MSNSQAIITWTLVIFAIISVSNPKVEAISPTMAPAGAPGPAAVDCTTLVYNMTDCLSYVSNGSTTTKPDKLCCPELAGMLDSNPVCLCQLLGGNKDLPIDLDFSRALKLPSVCGLKTPPLTMCSVVGAPIGAPTGAQAGGPIPSVVPSISEPPSGGIAPGASGPSPSAGKGTSAATNADFRLFYLVAALAIALTSFTF